MDKTELKDAHRKKYAQYAHIVKRTVRNTWSKKFLTEKLKEDRHLNNIPLAKWDRISTIYKKELAWKHEEITGSCEWSFSLGVCAAKEAAIQITEEKGDKNA